jgi:predicted dehydrogenase
MRIIQIGAGGFGRWWLEQVVDYPGVDVVALVDIDKGVLAEAGERAGVSPENLFADLDDALSAVSADVLLCVTPPDVHREHTTKAMRAGLDVIVEKPLATHMADARAMAAVASNTGRLMAVSQQYRYRPPTWTLHRQVRQGEIGELGQIRIDFYKGWYFGTQDFRRTMPDPLLADMAIHHFDLLRFITGLEAVAVSGESWNPPWSENSGDTSVNLTFTLSNGARFVYNASWVAQGDFSDWNGNWLLEGTDGSLRLAGDAIELRRAKGNYLTEDPVVVRPSGPPLVGQAYVLADMMAARREGRQPATSVFDNLKSLAMVMAAREAVRSEGPVPVESDL